MTQGRMDAVNMSGSPAQELKKKKKTSVTVSDRWAESGGLGQSGGKGEWVMVGTRLGHLRGLMERKSHAPCLLLPTVVPSFDCDPWIMHGGWDWRKREDGGTMVVVVVGGDLNLKGALPQWESLPMNNHTDEPWREKKEWEKEKERWGLNRKEKQTSYKKRKGFHEIKHCQHFKQLLIACFSSSVFITLQMFCCCFHLFIHLSIIQIMEKHNILAAGISCRRYFNKMYLYTQQWRPDCINAE